MAKKKTPLVHTKCIERQSQLAIASPGNKYSRLRAIIRKA